MVITQSTSVPSHLGLLLNSIVEKHGGFFLCSPRTIGDLDHAGVLVYRVALAFSLKAASLLSQYLAAAVVDFTAHVSEPFHLEEFFRIV